MKNTSSNDKIRLSKRVFREIINQVFFENGEIFATRAYVRSDKTKHLHFEFLDGNKVNIEYDVEHSNVKDSIKLDKLIKNEVTTMIEHITEFKVNRFNVNVIDRITKI
jgi:hypothetical protein